MRLWGWELHRTPTDQLRVTVFVNRRVAFDVTAAVIEETFRLHPDKPSQRVTIGHKTELFFSKTSTALNVAHDDTRANSGDDIHG